MIKSNITFDLKNENIRAFRWVIDTHARLWMSATLFATDFFSMFLAFLIAAQVRGIQHFLADTNYKELFVLLIMISSILFFRKGLYPAVGIHYVDELRHIVSSTALAYLILIGITFFLQTTLIYSRLVLIFAGALNTGFILLNRYLIRRIMIRSGLWGEPALIIGELRKAQPLVDYFMINLQLGIRPVSVVSDSSLALVEDNFSSFIQTGNDNEYFTRNLSVKTALVLMDDIGDAHRLAEKYRFAFQRVILIKDQEDNFVLTSLQAMDFLNIIGLQVKNDLLSESSRVMKRIVDVLGAFFGLLFLAPFMGLAAILIKLDSCGEVFYRQPRIGKNGVVFQLLKFRTMHWNADQIFKEALENDIKLKNEWTMYQKLKNDPRVTYIGGFMRKFSIDELPQLWNVLVGDMSLVGPRPIMVDQRKLYGEDIKYYYLVLPGLSGLWQVSGRNVTTFARRTSLDREYIQRWSLWLDFYIIFRTAKTVLFEKSAY